MTFLTLFDHFTNLCAFLIDAGFGILAFALIFALLALIVEGMRGARR